MDEKEPPNGGLADISESGKAVSSRICDPLHALKICERMVRDDVERASRRSKVQGAFNGNAPKSYGDMVRAGRGSDSNLNFKRHRGHIMNAWTPFFDMVCEVPVCIDGDVDSGDSAMDNDLMRGFAQYFHEMVFGWAGFDDMSQLCDLQMLLHGPGILAWEDAYDWKPKAILTGNIYFTDGTGVSLDNCEMAMLYTPMTAGQLWRKIKDEKAAKAAGWDIEAVKAVIMDSATSNSELYQWNRNWQRWDQAFKNGDIYVTQTQTKRIQLYTLFVEEMDGTISQKIIPSKNGQKETKFLFDSASRFDGWEQCLCLFPYDIGSDGTYHSIKGLGTDIYPFCALLNSIDNSIADLVVSGIKPMWQPTSNAKMEDFKMAKWGGGNFVPNGINPLQLNMSQGINPALEVSAAFTQTLTQNTAASNQQDLAAPTVEETAKGAMIRAAERAKVSKGLHNRYMRCKDRQYAEMWRRAVNSKLKSWHPGAKEALRFQGRCYRLCDKFGVPHGILQKVESVRANRSLGLGSAAMRLEIGAQFKDMAQQGLLDEQGRNNALRAYVSGLTSYSDVDAYVPSLSTGRDPTNDASIATLENDALGAGGKALVASGQNDVIHLGIHVGAMEEAAQLCQAGQQDPKQCMAILSGIGPHADEHLSRLAGNPTRKQEYKEFEQRLKAVEGYAKELGASLQDEAQQQQDTQEKLTADQEKVRGNLAIKQEKEQGNAQLKAQQQAFNQQLKAQQAAFDQALKDATTAAQIQRDTQTHRMDSGMAMDEHMMNKSMAEDETENE